MTFIVNKSATFIEKINSSGHQVQSPGLNNAERSIYMRDVFDYMNQTFWPGGCPWQP